MLRLVTTSTCITSHRSAEFSYFDADDLVYDYHKSKYKELKHRPSNSNSRSGEKKTIERKMDKK